MLVMHLHLNSYNALASSSGISLIEQLCHACMNQHEEVCFAQAIIAKRLLIPPHLMDNVIILHDSLKREQQILLHSQIMHAPALCAMGS